jgi:hypothetical protein
VQHHPITVFLVLTLGSVYVLSVIPILMQYDVIPGKNFRPGWASTWKGSPLLCSPSCCSARRCW